MGRISSQISDAQMIEATKSVQTIVGTNLFAAPEIERAWIDGSLERMPFEILIASDVYSLGKVLQCMVSLSPIPQSLERASATLEAPYRNLIT